MVRFMRSTMPFVQALYGLVCLFLDMREFCDAVYGDEHVLFAAGDLHFGAVDVLGCCLQELSHEIVQRQMPLLA